MGALQLQVVRKCRRHGGVVVDIRGTILCPQCASSPAENACGHVCCAPKWSGCGDNEWSGREEGVEEECTTPRGLIECGGGGGGRVVEVQLAQKLSVAIYFRETSMLSFNSRPPVHFALKDGPASLPSRSRRFNCPTMAINLFKIWLRTILEVYGKYYMAYENLPVTFSLCEDILICLYYL